MSQTISYNIWGLDRFYTADSSNKQRESITVNFDEGLQYIRADLPSADKYESYLCIVRGDVLAKNY